MKLRVITQTTIRRDANPNSRSFGVLQPGFVLDAEPHQDNPNWYVDANGFWYARDAVMEIDAAGPGLTLDIAARAPKLDWGGKGLGIAQIWNRGATGQGVTVAVLDTGVNLNHPDLQRVLARGPHQNFRDTTMNVEDVDGHGTQCAGIIAGQGIQMAGVAPGTKLIIGKITRSLSAPTADRLKEAILWAQRMQAKVISISQEADTATQELHETIRNAVLAGITIVAAIGNTTDMPPRTRGAFPAIHPDVIPVGAINRDESIWPNTIRDSNLILLAPGSSITTTDREGGYIFNAEGTSMAAPFVAGVVALMLSQNPNLKPVEIRTALMRTAKPIPGTPFKIVQPLAAFATI